MKPTTLQVVSSIPLSGTSKANKPYSITVVEGVFSIDTPSGPVNKVGKLTLDGQRSFPPMAKLEIINEPYIDREGRYAIRVKDVVAIK